MSPQKWIKNMPETFNYSSPLKLSSILKIQAKPPKAKGLKPLITNAQKTEKKDTFSFKSLYNYTNTFISFMAAKFQRWVIVLCLFSVLFISSIPMSNSQFNSPQNIETFYPLWSIPIAPPPNSPNNESISPPSPPPPPPLPLPATPSKSSSKKAVTTAVIATAASALVLSFIFFFFLQRRTRRKRDRTVRPNPYSDRPALLPCAIPSEFTRFNGNLKGLIVDEDGLDVLYWRKLEGGNNNNNNNNKKSFKKEEFKKTIDVEKGDEERVVIKKFKTPIQETPLLRGKSSTSHHQVWAEKEKQYSSVEAPPPPPPPPIPKAPSPPPPPPPPVPAKKVVAPPPQPLASTTLLAIPKAPSPPPLPPPPVPAKKVVAPPPPPPPKAGGLASSSKPPPARKGMPSESKKGKSSSAESQVQLKPLHWDKVNPNVDHSMVWDKLDGGSFRFDGDLMEALFGSVATNRKSPRGNSNSSSDGGKSSPLSQISFLDSRKSQNIAIVLRSLAISRREIIDALMEGQGLNADTLEKLTKMAPTKEEESDILSFDGDSTRLANAESFLFYLLKSVPSAFTRFNAMLFRSNYDLEILQLKESIQTLELGCNEMKTRGLFVKLLEAVLKAGNRMNAGTSRGNAQAFNLTALRKLSDVKSSDGKTTLLNFVVEEVVRAEGKRCVLNRNRSLNRNGSQKSNMGSPRNVNSTSNDEKEKEYIMLGLPIVGGLSSEFSNVKKAATIDYEVFSRNCSALKARVDEIRQLVVNVTSRDGFVREMKDFLDSAEEGLRVVREDQTRVMELVKRTTEYYQAGASKDKGFSTLQLFVIVKDFLGMVDQVCVDIARNLQKRRTGTTGVGSSSTSTSSSSSRVAVRFPKLPDNFMSDNSKSSSSDSEDEF